MRRLHTLALLALIALALPGCELIGDVLEFGFWTILILVALVVLLGWGLVRALSGRNRRPPPSAP